MNIEKIVVELEKAYPLISHPERNIMVIDEKGAREVICEFEKGKAMAVILKSLPHYHKKTTETYTVLKGYLRVYKNSRSFFIAPRETIVIPPDVPHYAVGNETWVLVLSDPPWRQEDHFLISDQKQY